MNIIATDPRDDFEKVFPLPKHVIRCGNGYACTEYNAWGAYEFIHKWEGWRAAKLGDGSTAAPAVQAEQLSGNAEQVTKCWCHTCRPVTMTDMRFVVCPDCGNKRCPHANDHRNACTGSNEPGQEGSAYPAAPKQEAE